METIMRVAERLIRNFFTAYLEQRDIEGALQYLTPSIQWVGTGKDEEVSGIEEARKALETEIKSDPDPYQLVFENVRVLEVFPYCHTLLCGLKVKRRLEDCHICIFEIRISACCVQSDGEWKISSLHASAPTTLQDEGETYPISFAEEYSKEFAERIGKNAMDLLGKNIPGGVMGGYLEPGFPLYYINDQMLKYLGYTYEEFVRDTNGLVINGIHPEDRERVNQEVKRAFSENRQYEVQYRMLKKGGDFIYVNDIGKKVKTDDGRSACISAVRDISAEVEAERRLRLELKNRRLKNQLDAQNEVLKTALEHTSICELYYYPLTKVCVMPERTCAHYGCLDRYDNMPEGFMESFVKPQYHASYREMFIEIHNGSKTAGTEFQTIRGDWCRVVLTTVGYTSEGEPDYVVGIVEDIAREKEMAYALEEAKCQDRLTGLWNKDTGIRLVQEYLMNKPPSQHCVMMLLDMDHFTELNEVEGAVFANAILRETADILRTETKEEDLRIRLGGDEFMLLVKNCDKKAAAITGPRIADRVKELLRGDRRESPISVSIGMCSTEVVKEYSGLYRCAESTLKYVKENNRGNAACYLDTSNELGVMLTNLYPDSHPVNCIEQENADGGENMVSFALDLLGKARNLEDAVLLIFARIGKSYGLDRISLLEIDSGFLTGSFTYQWIKGKHEDGRQNLFYLTKEEYEAAAARYDGDGLSEQCAIREISPYPSGLYAAVWDHGIYAGALSFESLRSDFVWTAEIKNLLSEMGRIIPSFVMKARADAVSQAKTDFLSRMSHEIRTPMNAIMGMTEIARSLVDDRERLTGCLDKLDASNQYLLQLINDILDMSRIESGKMELHLEEIRISETTSQLEEMLVLQAGRKDITLCVENEYLSDRIVLADELKLKQILINIIGNAIKFTERGGKIIFRIQPQKETDRNVSLRFSVKDNGIGIDKADQIVIFNLFEQGAQSRKLHSGGTGLGLAISSRLVQMMGGELEVDSEAGKGSEFYFTLSLPYGVQQPAVREQEEKIDTGFFAGKRLLVVEDNDINLEIATEILAMHGFLVESAVNGQEALERYRSQEPFYYDAVLMDIQMPVLDGIEATKRIRIMGRPDSRCLPIIAMTANAFDEDSRKSLENGMNGHLCKPIQVEELLRTLCRCMKEMKPD